ncbi:MAG TPA: hypothetical protein VGJ64_00385 [Gemmatimonadaceae bacterium]|jgi:hypothetical protein
MRADLKKRINSIEARLRESDAAIALAAADPDARRRRDVLEQYQHILREYSLIETALQRDQSAFALQTLHDLQSVSPLDGLADISRLLHTTIPGMRIVKLVVSQVFRIHDLLVAPDATFRPTRLLENILDRNALRRTLNRNATLDLPGLGTMRSVRTTQFEQRDFWARTSPELKSGSDPPISFVPFEMTPLPMLQGFRPDLASVVEETLTEAAGGARKLIENVQVDSRLRLYSPGVGVVRIGITMTFAEIVYVEVVARIARGIESLLLVSATNEEKNLNALLDDAVGALIAALFVEDTVGDRRWRPPDVSFVLHDDGVEPAANASAFAHLVALAPGNVEPLGSIEARLSRVLSTNEWTNSGILAFAGHRSAVLLGSRKGGRGLVATRRNTIAMLIELEEVIASAAYVQQLFEEKLLEITKGGQLDATWAVPGEKLDHLVRLLRAMRSALQAVMALKLQLEQHGAGVMLPFAKQLWSLRYRPPSLPLTEQLRILSNWIDQQNSVTDALREVGLLADQIGSFQLPFKTSPKARRGLPDQQLEASLLRNLDELESLIGTEGETDISRVQNLVADTVSIKARLGIS